MYIGLHKPHCNKADKLLLLCFSMYQMEHPHYIHQMLGLYNHQAPVCTVYIIGQQNLCYYSGAPPARRARSSQIRPLTRRRSAIATTFYFVKSRYNRGLDGLTPYVAPAVLFSFGILIPSWLIWAEIGCTSGAPPARRARPS